MRIRAIGEDQWLLYLLSWSEWPVGSQKVAAGIGVCDIALSWGRKVRIRRPVEATGNGAGTKGDLDGGLLQCWG